MTAAVAGVSGTHAVCGLCRAADAGAGAEWMSLQLSPVSSETRRPVWTARAAARGRGGLPSGSGRGRRAARRFRRAVRNETGALVEAFLRDGQHLLDEQGVLGMAQRGVAEQRPDARSAARCGSWRCSGGSASRWSRNAEIVRRPGRPSPVARGLCRCAAGRRSAVAARCPGRRSPSAGWPGRCRASRSVKNRCSVGASAVMAGPPGLPGAGRRPAPAVPGPPTGTSRSRRVAVAQVGRQPGQQA